MSENKLSKDAVDQIEILQRMIKEIEEHGDFSIMAFIGISGAESNKTRILKHINSARSGCHPANAFRLYAELQGAAELVLAHTIKD